MNPKRETKQDAPEHRLGQRHHSATADTASPPIEPIPETPATAPEGRPAADPSTLGSETARDVVENASMPITTGTVRSGPGQDGPGSAEPGVVRPAPVLSASSPDGFPAEAGQPAKEGTGAGDPDAIPEEDKVLDANRAAKAPAGADTIRGVPLPEGSSTVEGAEKE